MKEVSIIGVDLAKNVFQLHGAAADGTVLFRKKLSRPQFQRFMAEHPRCLVAMEACGGAHHWARELERAGHEVRLIAPRYVKPFIKRQKNDAADAEAIVEAALRPTMRYVEPKTGEQQARAILFRTREQFVKQRTEAINALRSHLYEFGYIAPEGIGYLPRLGAGRRGSGLGFAAARPGNLSRAAGPDRAPDHPDQCHEKEDRRDRQGRRDMPAGCRPCRAWGRSARWPIETFAPPMEQFKRGRDFAAWLGLVPRQASTGGKQRLGKTSKMGQRDIRRLLDHRRDGRDPLGAAPWRARSNPWLARLLERKPPMVAASALANKMARGIWAMMTRGEDYRGPVIGSAA